MEKNKETVLKTVQQGKDISVLLGNEKWRDNHRDKLEDMFCSRTIERSDSSLPVTEYRIKNKEAIFEFFLLFISGFTASVEVLELVDRYYDRHRMELNQILTPYVEGDMSVVGRALLNHCTLFCMSPCRVFASLVLFGMYLLGEDMEVVLEDYIEEYGLVILDDFFHTTASTTLVYLDTRRDNQQRWLSVEIIEMLLSWLKAGEDDWTASSFIEPILYESWILADNLHDLQCYQEGEYCKDFDEREEMEKMDELTPSVEPLSLFMSEVLRFPNIGECYADFSLLTSAFWAHEKREKGFKPYLCNKYVNFMYQSSWMTYCVSVLLTSIQNYLQYRILLEEEKKEKTVLKEVRQQSDILRIESLEKQVEKKQQVINDFELKKNREMQALQDKISALEEEVLYYKEQQTCEKQLQELEQDAKSDVPYERMVEELNDLNLVVVGGHENWIARMKNVLPLSKFASRKLGDIPQLSSAVDAVFFKFDQSSHVAYFKVKSMCKSCGVPFYYISGTSHKDCIRQMYMQVYYSN